MIHYIDSGQYAELVSKAYDSQKASDIKYVEDILDKTFAINTKITEPEEVLYIASKLQEYEKLAGKPYEKKYKENSII